MVGLKLIKVIRDVLILFEYVGEDLIPKNITHIICIGDTTKDNANEIL